MMLSQNHSYDLIKKNLEKFNPDDVDAFRKTAAAMGDLLSSRPHPPERG
ncbi:MAG: hypothetical protein R2875_15230 [Desulfobacterales bacterium]